MQSLGWYVQRLRRMSGGEVVHRLGRAALSATRRLELARSQSAPTADLSVPERFFVPPFTRGASTDAHDTAILAAARRIAAGRLTIFDLQDFPLGDSPEWNRDPLTRRVAPWRASQTIDYRDEREVGNIKYLWEPNRHLHLATLAQAYALTGDESFAHVIVRHVDSWIVQCPAGRGPNWVSALELGIRLINWSIAWQLIGGMQAPVFGTELGREFRSRWLAAIYQHARAIAHNLSRFSSANNHLVGEAAGVYVASVTWPLWRQVRTWGERCREHLAVECLKQNAPDGGNREQALGYLPFVFDFLLLAGLAARAADHDFKPEYWRRLESMAEFVASMMDVAGHVPMIGDADDGYVVRLSADEDFCPYRSLIATSALLFRRADLAAKARRLDAQTRTLLGREAPDAFARLLAQPEAQFAPVRAFPDSGYYLLGSDLETSREARVLIDAGPLGYLSLAAHGHADALAVLLNLGGREILVDPGTYAYHTEPEWRRYFRGTNAHNTVVVDGLDQSEQRGNFMWSNHAHARCLGFSSGPGTQCFRGEHDGYRRLRDPVTHRRELEYRDGEAALLISDTLECAGVHEVTRRWQIGQGLQLSRQGDAIRLDAGVAIVTLKPLEPLREVTVHNAGSASEGGWISRRFGHKEPCCSVSWHSRVEATTTLRTRITWQWR
jgi:hypothetical protein